MGWGGLSIGRGLRRSRWAVGGYGEVFWMLEVWKLEFVFLIFLILSTRR